jgi:hypothetical protein
MSAHDVPRLLVELGAAILGLAVLARVANRLGMSAIPLYLLAGLCFGNDGLVPLRPDPAFHRDRRWDRRPAPALHDGRCHDGTVLGSVSAAYVLLLALAGPLLARVVN